jgi:hypothetical protein
VTRAVTCQIVLHWKSQKTLTHVRVSVAEQSGALVVKFALRPHLTSASPDLPDSAAAPMAFSGLFAPTIKRVPNVAMPVCVEL